MPPTIKLRLSVRGDTIKVKAGEPVNIPADVTGLPMPKIEWSKNETVIEKPTDALKITKEEVSRSEAKTELSIPKATREDKGTYTVTASGAPSMSASILYIKYRNTRRRTMVSRPVCRT